MTLTIQRGLTPEHQDEALLLFCKALRAKISPFLGPPERAARFLARAIRREQALVALQDGRPLGMLAMKHGARGVFPLRMSDFVSAYPLTGLVRAAGLAMIDHTVGDDEILIDGIAVSDEARGLGVGTALMDTVEAVAREAGCSRLRLYVIDTNPKAQALYERLGFVVDGQEAVGPMRAVLSFSAAISMHKPLS